MRPYRFQNHRRQILFTLLLLLSGIFLLPASQSKSQNQPTLGFHIARGDVEHIEAAKAAGAGFVVIVFNWDTIEPDPNNVYWEVPDAALRTAEYYGLQVVARLDRPPQWAFDGTNPSPWQLLAYEAFVRRVASRYADRLAGIIVWNEPNLSLEWDGRPPIPEGYVQMLRPAYRAVKLVAPDLPVLAAGLAMTTRNDNTAMSDLEFLQGIYEAGGAEFFDILAAHPYGFGQPPTEAPDPDRLNFRRLELQREIMAANGDAAKPIWITEMGWRTDAPNPSDVWQVVSPQQQSDYIFQAIDYAAENYPWLEKMALWELNNQGDDYGYYLWHGAEEISQAYQDLVDACASTGRNCQLDPSRSSPATAAPISILAPDVAIRLGDRGTLHPHWVHLHRGGENFSPDWQGDFFLTSAQANQSYDLYLETMQVDQPTNRILINNVELAYLQTRTRPDITSTWVTQRFALDKSLLQPGRNQIKIIIGPRNPARQYSFWRWENFQFRNIRLVAPQATTQPLLADWRATASPNGGQRWNKVHGLPPTLSDLLIDPDHSARWLAGTAAGVYRSQDQGQSWQAVSPPWTVWDMDFGADGRLFVARTQGVAWADNLSSPAIAWQETSGLSDVLFFNVEPHPTDPRVLLAGSWGNDLGVSYDGGETMRSVNNGLETLSVLDILWHPNQGQLTVGTIEGLFRTDNFGEAWFKLPGSLKQQTVYSLYQTEDSAIWAGAANGLWVSGDYGVTWQRIDSIPPVTIMRLGEIRVDDQFWLWAGTELNGLWVSPDQGESWQFGGLADKTIYNLQTDPLQPNRLIAATDQGIFLFSP